MGGSSHSNTCSYTCSATIKSPSFLGSSRTLISCQFTPCQIYPSVQHHCTSASSHVDAQCCHS